jgi:lysophospholipase L1-like esterase
MSRLLARLLLAVLLGGMLELLGAPAPAMAQSAAKWVTVWTGADQGPYPVGNPSAQPNLSLAFPVPATGAHDQTFRMIVRPDIWGWQARLRFSNSLGTRPVTLDGVFVGLQATGGTVATGTNRPVGFAGRAAVTIPPGETVWSEPVSLPWARPGQPIMQGRKLAVSFHVVGDSGPMTWHAKALTTSYLSGPGAGAYGQAEDDVALPYTTTSWYFLDAVDMMAPPSTHVIVAFGDSITDGTASTLNGDDRWPDVLSQRLHRDSGEHFAVVNQGIGGNRIIGPADYSPHNPFAGGPGALHRLDRDVIGLSGVTTVIWFEGINDLGVSAGGTTPAQMQAAMTQGVATLRQHIRGVRVIGATLTSALGSSNAEHGSAEEDAARRSFNAWVRAGGVFDGYVDFDEATTDPATGALRAEFVPDSTIGGPGDKLHPNRLGYQAMADAIDLDMLK